MTEILKRYLSKSKEPVLSVILAAGVWLANEVKHEVADVSAQLTKMDARIAAIERSLGNELATK